MKIKILVIFILMIITTYLIYNNSYKEDSCLLISINKKSYNQLNYTNNISYNKITFKELNNEIKSNGYIIIKNKEIYISQLMRKSDKIIIDTNYKNLNCNLIKNELNELIDTITLISHAKIYIINDNYDKCNLESNKYTLINLNE